MTIVTLTKLNGILNLKKYLITTYDPTSLTISREL